METNLPDPFTPIEVLRRRRFCAAAASVAGIAVGTVAEKWALTQNDQTLPLTIGLMFIGSFIGIQEAVNCHDELESKVTAKNNMIDQLVYEIQSSH